MNNNFTSSFIKGRNKLSDLISQVCKGGILYFVFKLYGDINNIT